MDLVFLHSSFIPFATHSVDKYMDGYYSLQYMAAGAVDLAYDGVTQRMQGCWFWLAYPGPHITFHRSPGTHAWSHRHAAFQGPLLERWHSQGLLQMSAQPAPEGVNWARRFDALLESIGREGRWARLSAVNQLEAILLTLAEARTLGQPSPPAWLNQVLGLLDEQDTFRPDYNWVAAKLNMAPSTLRHQFREVTGHSLHAHVIHERMVRACDLLADTDLPVKTISSLLGYKDVYFFTRQFASSVGVPPARFRRSRQL